MRDPFPPDCAARFRAERELGAGGYGAVWRAHDTKLDRAAAVKLLHAESVGDAEQVARFEREARVTAGLAHPNVVDVLDAGSAHGIPWIAYELLEGKSLAASLDAGPLPVRRALEAARQIASALAAAHGAGVLHRDVKPDNVIAAGPDLWKVTDFGIARCAGDTRVKTATGVILGTPAYIAPEQVEGEDPSPSSDIYALGVTLYELLTAQVPFSATTPLQLLEMHRALPPTPPSARCAKVPLAVDRLVLRALAKSPKDRFASAADLAAALAQLIDATPGHGAASVSAPRHVAPRATTARVDASAPGASVASSRTARRALGATLAFALAAVLAVGLATRPAPPPVKEASPRLRELLALVNAMSAQVRLARARVSPDLRGLARREAFEKLVGTPAAAQVRAQLPLALKLAKELAPDYLAGPPVDTASLAFAGAVCELLPVIRQANAIEDPKELIVLYDSWANRWPDSLVAAFPLASSKRREPAFPERFNGLIGRAPPPRDRELIESWCSFQLRIARMHERDHGDDSLELRRELARAVLAHSTASGWPDALRMLDLDLLLTYDSLTLSSALQLTDARGKKPTADELRELDVQQAGLERELETRAALVAGAPDGYDVLHVALLGTELEPQHDARRVKASRELVDKLRKDHAANHPWLPEYVDARRAVRDGSGLAHQELTLLAPAHLKGCVEKLAVRPPPEPGPESHPFQADQHLKRWTNMVLWACLELEKRQEPGAARTAALAVQKRCGPLLGTKGFAWEKKILAGLLQPNLPAPAPTN